MNITLIIRIFLIYIYNGYLHGLALETNILANTSYGSTSYKTND